MTTAGATGLIKITSLPRGEAPEEIRAAWMDLLLPCYPIAGYLTEFENGVLSESVRKEKRMCVVVPQSDALLILEERHPEIAKWWRSHDFPRRVFPNFTFGLEEVSFVSGVRLQTVIEITDEMMGDPNR